MTTAGGESAPCEAAMLLDEWFTERCVRSDIEISVVSPWGTPIPASPPASAAILERFAERNIEFIRGQRGLGVRLRRCRQSHEQDESTQQDD